MRPTVVKIGGSLAETGRLAEVLKLVARARRPTVIVPGGGPFADAVRRAQAEAGFSDATAHDMALLATEQMGLLFLDHEPRLVPAATLAEMGRALSAGRKPVWMAYRLARRDRTIPHDWSATSDALAARLAERLEAPVVLVKSRRVDKAASAEALAREGVVDPVFAEIVGRAHLPWCVFGPGEEAELAARLGADRPAARRSPRNKAFARPSTARRARASSL